MFRGLNLLPSSGGGVSTLLGPLGRTNPNYMTFPHLAVLFTGRESAHRFSSTSTKRYKLLPNSHTVTRPTYRPVLSGAFIHSVKHIYNSYVPNSHPRFKWFREHLQMTPCHHVSSSCEIWLAFNPLKSELHLNNIYKYSSNGTGNSLRLHHKGQPLNALKGHK
jgi:hypothetical protein